MSHYSLPLQLMTMCQTARSRNTKTANCSSVARNVSNSNEHFQFRECLEYFVLLFTYKIQSLNIRKYSFVSYFIGAWDGVVVKALCY
jgi:hypothetical protein